MANGNYGKEFIHGSGDGPGNASDTYTICRVEVPRQQVVEEIHQGMHPKYDVVKDEDIEYPHNRTDTNQPHARMIDNVNHPKRAWQCPAQSMQATAAGEPVPGIVPKGAKTMELIHGDKVPSTGAKDRTYTICRLGVPRRQLVREIDAGMHPGYRVEDSGDRRYPSPANVKATQGWNCCFVR